MRARSSSPRAFRPVRRSGSRKIPSTCSGCSARAWSREMSHRRGGQLPWSVPAWLSGCAWCRFTSASMNPASSTAHSKASTPTSASYPARTRTGCRTWATPASTPTSTSSRRPPASAWWSWTCRWSCMMWRKTTQPALRSNSCMRWTSGRRRCWCSTWLSCYPSSSAPSSPLASFAAAAAVMACTPSFAAACKSAWATHKRRNLCGCSTLAVTRAASLSI
mmetsp:Transcript_13543/g.24041  ORF Transcript_13543/g.24041 Transcript_13543/m.24041 type:complete len:220 (-) Transcript_13543:1628-2287(-)